MKLRLTRNLQLGFGLSLLFLIGISAASYVSIQNLFKSSDLVAHSNKVIQKLEYTISIMKDAETGQRGYLLTGNKVFLEPYQGSYHKAVGFVTDFQQLTKDNPQQQVNAVKIKRILLNRLNILALLIDKKRAGKTVTTDDLLSGKSSMDALRTAINVAESDEDKLLQTRLNSLERFTSLTPVFVVFATVIATVISVFAYFRVMNGIAERAKLYAELAIKEQETAAVNEELASANEELNAANEDLATFNEELNAANEEIASANEELNASNEELVAAQESVRDLNEKLGASNEELSASVDDLFQSHQDLKELNEELEDRVVRRTRALTESETRFRVMMETMPKIAWTNTLSGEVTFFNKYWYDYTGLIEEQSLGWGWTAAVHPDDLPAASEKFKGILDSGEKGEFETRKKRTGGDYRWHLIRMQPVMNDTGEIQQWVGVATDIHELKNLQQQKDDFISIASHELKTPVTSLKVSLQLLDRMKDNPSIPIFSKLIGQANKSLNKVGALIEELLNLSKLNQGQLHLNKTQFNVSQLIEDSCQHVRIEGTFDIITTGDLKLQAYADAERIEQVVVNIVNNAVKYAPDSKKINIKIEKENDMAKVSVSDKGPGIASEKVPHLFDRYYRVDSDGVQFSGLGLGLYISSEIIKRHDGQIGVDTEIGKGSTFWFTMPLKDSAAAF